MLVRWSILWTTVPAILILIQPMLRAMQSRLRLIAARSICGTPVAVLIVWLTFVALAVFKWMFCSPHLVAVFVFGGSPFLIPVATPTFGTISLLKSRK